MEKNVKAELFSKHAKGLFTQMFYVSETISNLNLYKANDKCRYIFLF